MLKHAVIHHPKMDPSIVDFKMRILSSHKSAFERQIREAVLIQKYSGKTLMNSKTEYNRCSIPRITVKMDNRKAEEDPNVVTEKHAVEEIKRKYPDNKKRTAKACEGIKGNLVKLDKTGKIEKKRMKLDIEDNKEIDKDIKEVENEKEKDKNDVMEANKFTTDLGRTEHQMASNVVQNDQLNITMSGCLNQREKVKELGRIERFSTSNVVPNGLLNIATSGCLNNSEVKWAEKSENSRLEPARNSQNLAEKSGYFESEMPPNTSAESISNSNSELLSRSDRESDIQKL